MKKLVSALLLGAAAVALWGLGEPALRASDHADSPATVAAGSSDIADLYAFTNPSATKVSLIMTFNPGVAADEPFDTGVDYIFHLSSSNGAGGTAVSYQVSCNFSGGAPQGVTCSLEDGSRIIASVTGDVDTDLCSAGGSGECDGELRVYAAAFDDPFFHNTEGFDATLETLRGLASGFETSEHGCPIVRREVAEDLVDCLETACNNFGGSNQAAQNSYAGGNVQGIALEIPRSAIDGGGRFLDVWAATVVGTSQVDRAGRPMISALVGALGGDAAAVGKLRDDYNANADRSSWDYRKELEKTLAIFDALNSEEEQ